VLNPDTRPSDGCRISHQAAGAGIDYDKTFEPGYFAALWQKIEQLLLETILRPLGGRERTVLDLPAEAGVSRRLQPCSSAQSSASTLGTTPYSNHKALMTISEAALGNPARN
jgi:hypothetical protein